MLLLGAHLSIAGGFANAVKLAGRLRCNSIQVFVKNQRQWRASPITEAQIEAWREALDRAKPPIMHVVAHSNYLINLASDRAAIRRRSIAALAEELERCRVLGIDRLVMHPGSHRGQGRERGIALVAEALDRVLGETPGVRILLEATSGAGDCLGSAPEELGRIIAACRDTERIGCCLDTCHLFAAWFRIGQRDGFEELMGCIDRSLGLGRVGCVHLNDSAGELASRRDRHTHIGRGRIGLDAFRYFLTDPRLSAAPKVIETPKGKTLAHDGRNLRILRGLAEESDRRNTEKHEGRRADGADADII